MGNFVDSLVGNNKPPPAPDYRGLAQETAAGDLESARYQTLANRPDEYGPLGSRDVDTGVWRDLRPSRLGPGYG